jgi:hypothetical protein
LHSFDQSTAIAALNAAPVFMVALLERLISVILLAERVSRMSAAEHRSWAPLEARTPLRVI